MIFFRKLVSLENRASGAIDATGSRNATDIFEGGTKSRNLAIGAIGSIFTIGAKNATDLFELVAKSIKLKGNIYLTRVPLGPRKSFLPVKRELVVV